MSFSESIIIPLSLFKACQLDKLHTTESPESKLLNDMDLHSSKKMQLYNQMKHLSTTNKNKPDTIKVDTSENYKQDILSKIAEKHRPNISSILDVIHDHPDIIKIDNSTLGVSIYGHKINDSNAIDIMRAITKNDVVTRESDIAPGALQVYYTLIDELNIPKSWMPLKVVELRRSSRKRKKPSDNEQEGGWIII